MIRQPLIAQTDLVVVNRPSQPGGDRVVLTSDRGKFWLSGQSSLWPEQSFPVRGQASITFWPGQLKGQLARWQPGLTAILDQQEQSMVADWLSWLNRQLEVTPVSPQADPDLEPSQFWQVFNGAWSLLVDRRVIELAGAYFYLRVFELSGQSFQLVESSDSQPLTGKRFRFNADRCCFEPSPRGQYGQNHIKLLRYLTAVEPGLVARISASKKLISDTWQLIKGHPGYTA